MISPALVSKIEELRSSFLLALQTLNQSVSFQSLRKGTPRLEEEMGEIERVARSPRITRPPRPGFSCAIIGSSGHGKTSILAEMFPDLARRGWLQTDITDTTSQALMIGYAPQGSSEREEVVVHSWSLEQVTRLARSAAAENDVYYISTRYHPDHVEIDGTAAILPQSEKDAFRFGLRHELRPLPRPYVLSAEERQDFQLIRALTVKEPREQVMTRAVLDLDGQSLNVMQLRTVIKEVLLKDSFSHIVRWSGRPASELASLLFIDTPGLRVGGTLVDEILRGILSRKSQQIVVELIRQDELDLIVHLVICGEKSDFAQLWGPIREQCDPDDLADLGERLILAINGTNRYFTNDDLIRKWQNPTAAAREGDHFSTTLRSNILDRLSDHGPLTPARIVFLDCKRIVESLYQKPYQQFYNDQRATLERWTRPGEVGYQTLESLGLIDRLRQNFDALCDPEDRGQGFLVRQILEVIAERGPQLFLRKYLLRSKLFRSLRKLRETLLHYYDKEGRLSHKAIQDTLRKVLSSLSPESPESIEHFAAEHFDAEIDRLVPTPGTAGADPDRWVQEAFQKTCQRLYQTLITRAHLGEEARKLFTAYLNEQVKMWNRSWGYVDSRLPLPTRQLPASGEILRHCLKLHVREMLHLLLRDATDTTSGKIVPQDPQDQKRMQELMGFLDQMLTMARNLCSTHGVQLG